MADKFMRQIREYILSEIELHKMLRIRKACEGQTSVREDGREGALEGWVRWAGQIMTGSGQVSEEGGVQ